MSELKFCSLWALVIVVVTGLVFAVDYSWLHGTFPGYEVLSWPGVVLLRFFSEEISFSVLASSLAWTLSHARPLWRFMFFSNRAFNTPSKSSR